MKKVWLAVLLLFLTSCSTTFKKNNLENERVPAGNLVDNFLYPYSKANDSAALVVIPPDGFIREELLGSNGLKIISWSRKCNKPNGLTVIYIHGNGESLSTIASTQNLSWLTSRDINFVMYDFPKYGLSTGDLTEKSMLEAANLVFTSTLKNFPQSDIVVIGRSLGTAVAVQLMGQQEVQSRVQGLVLISPWTSFPDVIKHKIGFVAGMFSTKDQEYNNLAIAPDISTQTLILHGDADRVIAPQLGQTLAKAFPADNVSFQLLTGLDHNKILLSPELHEAVINFLTKVEAANSREATISPSESAVEPVTQPDL